MAKDTTVDLIANYGPVGNRAIVAASVYANRKRKPNDALPQVAREIIPTPTGGEPVAKIGKHD